MLESMHDLGERIWPSLSTLNPSGTEAHRYELAGIDEIVDDREIRIEMLEQREHRQQPMLDPMRTIGRPKLRRA